MKSPLALSFLLLLSLTACEPIEQPAASIDYDAARQQIAESNRLFSEYFVAGDTTSLGTLYTADGMILPPGGKIQGRTGIREYFAPRETSTLLSHKLESESLIFQDSTATDVGMWSNTWQVPDQETGSSSGRYLVIWRLEPDGQWRMEYDIWQRP
ncbi:MAG: nuclear transport factor 2 family protein [Rhodothermaceae bacterium]|nr:nuclear transport factor 2 family protein [Rhodothermaceae bacterium]